MERACHPRELEMRVDSDVPTGLRLPWVRRPRVSSPRRLHPGLLSVLPPGALRTGGSDQSIFQGRSLASFWMTVGFLGCEPQGQDPGDGINGNDVSNREHSLKFSTFVPVLIRYFAGEIRMFFRMQALCTLGAAGLLMGLLAVSHADSLKVKTEQGKVVGKTINNGKVRAFLGLPYAAPPVGDLRWKAPQPAANGKASGTRRSMARVAPRRECMRTWCSRMRGQAKTASS